MGSFEVNYDEGALKSFTEEESCRLRALHHQLDENFSKIASLLAGQLGLSETDPRCGEEAEEAIEQWEEDTEMANTPPSPQGPLQHLLHEHHEISEQIMNIRDEAVERQCRT